VELSRDDAERRGIATGDDVAVKSDGAATTLRARVNRRLLPGVARIAEEHAADLHATVEVTKA
jgi:anaerobic selenocysteine-containing dehydrogenase